MKKRYTFSKPNESGKFSRHDGVLVQLLTKRGLMNDDEADAFISPQFENELHDPFLLSGMEKAVERILQAVQDNQKVVIYTDYDTDGIPGAVVLSDFFRKIGFENFTVYIPHRHLEGYGLHMDAVNGFIKDGVQLIITIDCGTNDIEPINLASNSGIDVVVTDHHEPHGERPRAFSVINPKNEDDLYPFKDLCGSGVIFKLIQALISKGNFSIPIGWEKWLLDMVGIATIADMVPLVGENRVFAKYGLMVLRKTPRKGLGKLFSKIKLERAHITEDDIGFTIGPRINAASRMDVPMTAFDLLSTNDETFAQELANTLESLNNKRKGLVASMVKEIDKRIRERTELPNVIVIGDPDFKPSLAGLVANSVAERFKKPVFVWGREGGSIIKGSCRSTDHNLVEIMGSTEKDMFLNFGGHRFSGGFSVLPEKIHFLEQKLNESFDLMNAKIDSDNSVDDVEIDALIDINEISWRFVSNIENLSPFGLGNPKPLFAMKHVVPDFVGQFGKEGNHVKITFPREGKDTLEAIAFFKTSDDFAIMPTPGQPLNIIFHLEKSFFLGRPKIRLRLIDIVESLDV